MKVDKLEQFRRDYKVMGFRAATRQDRILDFLFINYPKKYDYQVLDKQAHYKPQVINSRLYRMFRAGVLDREKRGARFVYGLTEETYLKRFSDE